MKRFLNPEEWEGLTVGHLQVADSEDAPLEPGTRSNTQAAYRPMRVIPRYVLVRLSDSERRLTGTLDARKVASGGWGNIWEVFGHGAMLGILMEVTAGMFAGAQAFPDGIHLMGQTLELPAESITKDLFVGKTIRLFAVGAPGQDVSTTPHDYFLTSKVRWFRERHTPKYLGLVKEDKS